MSDTPESRWVLEKNYFTVRPVNNFRLKYIEWLYSYEPSAVYTAELKEFLDYMDRNDAVQVYEFPNEGIIRDYFEMSDDNHVIPRELFNLVDG